MARFENIQVFGPGMKKTANGTNDAGEPAAEVSEATSVADPADHLSTADAHASTTALYSDVAAFVNGNRRLAIFGAFAIGVFLGSLSRS